MLLVASDMGGQKPVHPAAQVSILDRPEGQLEMIHAFLCLTPGPCPANCGAIDLIHENQKYQRNEFRSTGIGIKPSSATSPCAASPPSPKSAVATTGRPREPRAERAADSLGGLGRTVRTSVR